MWYKKSVTNCSVIYVYLKYILSNNCQDNSTLISKVFKNQMFTRWLVVDSHKRTSLSIKACSHGTIATAISLLQQWVVRNSMEVFKWCDCDNDTKGMNTPISCNK